MIGHTISHYRILQKIGGGGMGLVYKAEDLKLRRHVALKFLAPELTRDEDAKKRFLHEAQAASALDHPNICSIYEIDETPEGQVFIAMACYEGESVRDRIARRPIAPREAFEIAFSVAQGLARAHVSGIIHRDIKPANVMITGEGFVKIIDFGLSKLIGRSRVTGSGATLGTVAYMSPEQARSEEVDARTDLWSLGALLYEMVSGRIPFRGEIDQAVVYSILNEEPAPLRELRPELPESLAAVVMKCLRKNPDERYQSALEFCEAVVDASRGLGWGESFTGGAVRPVSVVTGGRARGRRTRVWVGAAAAVVVAGAVFGWRAWRADSIYSTEVRLAVMPLERLGDAPSQAFVDGLSWWTTRTFEQMSPVHRSMWVVPFARVWEDRPAEASRVRSVFGVNRILTGDVQRFGSSFQARLVLADAGTLKPIRTSRFRFDASRPDSLDRALRGAVREIMDLHREPVDDEAGVVSPAIRPFLSGLGVSLKTDSASVAAATAEANDACRADPSFAPAYWLRGRVAFANGARRGDASAPEQARADFLAALAIDSTYVPAYLWLARVCERARNRAEALEWLKRALERDPSSIDAYQDLGNAYAMAQRYDECEKVYRALVDRFPDYYHGYWRLGWLYNQVRRDAEVETAHERALQLAPEDYRALNSLGNHYSQRGEWARARELYHKAYLIHPTCANTSNVGLMLYFEGQFREAARYYEYALESCDTNAHDTWGNLAASLFWTEERRKDALPVFRHAIAVASRRLEMVPDDELTAGYLADYRAMIGDREGAVQAMAGITETDDADVLFRLACASEKLGDRRAALDYLGEAVRRDYPRHRIENEPVFRDLIRDAQFRQIKELVSVTESKVR